MTKKDKQYFENPAYSQSDIKHAIGATYYNVTDDKFEAPGLMSRGLIIGSVVDALLTESFDEFLNSYYVYLGPTPSVSILEIIHSVYHSSYLSLSEEDKKITTLANLDQEILSECSFFNYGQSWKPETRLRKVIDEGKEFFDALVEANGREIVLEEYAKIAWDITKSLLLSKATGPYFELKNLPDVEVRYQEEIYFKLSGFDCKGKLDMIVINHSDKAIETSIPNFFLKPKSIVPIDIKTTSENVWDFPKAARKYRYDIQAAWYSDGLATIFDYMIDNFRFIVESSTNIGNPRVFITSPEDLEIGRNGATIDTGTLKFTFWDEPQSITTTFDIKGYKQGIEAIIYKIQNDKWESQVQYEEQKGHYNLSIHGEYK